MFLLLSECKILVREFSGMVLTYYFEFPFCYCQMQYGSSITKKQNKTFPPYGMA